MFLDILGHGDSSGRATRLLHAFRSKTRSLVDRLECSRLLAAHTVRARQRTTTSTHTRTTSRGHMLFEQSSGHRVCRVDSKDMGGRHGSASRSPA